MSNLMEESCCGCCCEIKPSSEFEQSVPAYRLPWLKEELSHFKESSRDWLEGDQERELEPDEEMIYSYKSDLRTADDILRIINDEGLLDRNTAQGLKPHSVEIPINDYQRKWLKDTFSWERKCRQRNWRDAKKRKHERAVSKDKGRHRNDRVFLENY
ncbi:MAG: hypothetical protein WB988_03905 [Candidatus Nitrosopolaris sp.]|jgi:hypothetical protein